MYPSRFQVDGEEKYLPEVQELIRPERNTLSVSYQDVESYNAQLSTLIQEEYYRWDQNGTTPKISLLPAELILCVCKIIISISCSCRLNKEYCTCITNGIL